MGERNWLRYTCKLALSCIGPDAEHDSITITHARMNTKVELSIMETIQTESGVL